MLPTTGRSRRSEACTRSATVRDGALNNTSIESYGISVWPRCTACAST